MFIFSFIHLFICQERCTILVMIMQPKNRVISNEVFVFVKNVFFFPRKVVSHYKSIESEWYNQHIISKERDIGLAFKKTKK